jgi:3-oxoacyl-[acyl-carrier protein] reductase
MNLNLNNKNALVCGSTAGIGKATALALAAEGVNITLIARNEDKLKQVLAELPSHRNHNYIVADFSNPIELKEKVANFISKNHGFHILINNTGGPRSGAILTATLEEFENTFNL